MKTFRRHAVPAMVALTVAAGHTTSVAAQAPVCSTGPDFAVNLSGCGEGDVVMLHGINFALDVGSLDINGRALLDPVADALTARPDLRVEIGGHTDALGSEAYNLTLSEQRAEATVAYLVSRGIDPGRLTAQGYGEAAPVDTNDTEEGRAMNRRVELKVIGSLPVAALPTPTPAPTGPVYTTSEISIVPQREYVPAEIIVPPGTLVRWTNNDPGFHHAVTLFDRESSRISPGDTYSWTFDRPGTYHYASQIYPDMKGVIKVVANGTAAKPVEPPPPAAPVAAAPTPVPPPAAVSAPAAAPVATAAAAPAAAAGNTVKIVDFMTFSPGVLKVAAGTTVTFENHDGSNHIVAFRDGPMSPRLRDGATWTRTFDTPGEYPYICDIHGERMSGTIIVE